MFEDIKRNKIKSWIIVLLFLIFISLIVYYICMALDLGTISIVIALIFSIASTWGSYYYSDKIVLSLSKARPATKEENLKLVNILDALVVSSGLPCTPKLYIIEDVQPNAFATGRNPDGLISALQKISGDPNELNVANNATENMYIVNPFRGKKSSSSLWSTHPSIEDRIEALRHIK